MIIRNGAAHFWSCPECGHMCFEGSISHQHPSGEWITTESVATYWQHKRWKEIEEKKENHD